MPEFERAHKSQQADYLSEIEKLVRQKIADGQVAASFTEDQNAALTELCVLYHTNQIAYAIRLKELQPEFGVALKYIENVVKKIVEQVAPAKVKLENDDEIVQELVRLAKQNADLWHNEFKVGYATIERDGHIENLQVEKQDFQHLIVDKFKEEWEIYPPQRCVKSALYHIENHARQGEERDPKVRIAAHQDEIWIDLGDRNWSAIVVNADGWRIEPRMLAPLVRGAGVRPLPIPARDGDIHELREFANVRDDSGAVLFCGGIATI